MKGSYNHEFLKYMIILDIDHVIFSYGGNVKNIINEINYKIFTFHNFAIGKELHD